MLIKAEKTDNGFTLVAKNGDMPQEGFAYATEKEAYAAAAQLYPANSTWHGRRVPGGYRIDISPVNYLVDYHTGAGDLEIDGDLDEAKRQADKNAAYTQQDIEITDTNGNTVARRPWWGVEADSDDEEDIIEFGKFGHYGEWEEM
jgi:hypothetical protein